MKPSRFLILASLLALAVPSAATGAPPPRQFFGIEAKDVFNGSPVERTQEIARQRQTGLGLTRTVFDWDDIERQAGRPHHYTFSSYDAFVAENARQGIEVMPLLFNPPNFRSSRPSGNAADGVYPPSDFAEMGRLGAAVAARYGPNGSFWAANPGLPRVPIRSYQLWNEPHLPAFWPAGPNPAEYARLVKEAAPHIKAADPGARIVTAGISQSALPGAIPMQAFFRGMYDAGAQSAFDVLAVHPYSQTPGGAIALVEQTRALMNSRGDRSTPLRVTEMGWASRGPAHPFTTSEAGQAANLRATLAELTARRGELGLDGFTWHGWRDLPPPPDFWGQYTGLIRSDFSLKPSWFAMRDLIATLRELPLAPGSTPGSLISANLARDFAGVNAPELLAAGPVGRDRALATHASIGMGLLRQVFDWRRIERRRGRYRLGAYDALVAAAARRGVQVLPVLHNRPRFRRARELGRFAAVLARRYGRSGSLWRQRPDLPRTAVTAWQVWEAPNDRSAWGSRPSPRRYAGLLKAVRRSVRAVDRRAEIVTGALSSRRSAVRPGRFIRDLYRARGRPYFDTLGLAPLGRTPRSVLSNVRGIRRLMNRYRDRGARIWVTSFGWSDRGPRGPYRAGRSGQARNIERTLAAFGDRRRSWRLRGVVYARWRDRRARRNASWIDHAGVLGAGGRAKRAYPAFTRGLRALG